MSSAGCNAGSRERPNVTAPQHMGPNGPNVDSDADCVPDTAVVVISRGGVDVACRLAAGSSIDLSVHVADRYADLVSSQVACPVEAFPLPLRPVIGQIFGQYRRLVLIMPVGAAVRLIAPLLEHKHHDPAVVCVDDAGRFAVSLLSGHLGGADVLAQEVADALGAVPVITSASHVMNTLAVDLLGREYDWRLEADSISVTRVSAAVVNGEPVAVLQEAGEREWTPAGVTLPANWKLCASPKELVEANCSAALIISDREKPFGPDCSVPGSKAPMVVYRPRSLVVGMGCRRGVSREHLEEMLIGAFRKHNLSLKSIKSIATADIKGDEPGILELAEKYVVPVACYRAEELNAVFETDFETAPPEEAAEVGNSAAVTLTRSQAAHRLLGVWGVSEPAALLASGASQLLVSREKTDRATIAVARIPFD